MGEDVLWVSVWPCLVQQRTSQDAEALPP